MVDRNQTLWTLLVLFTLVLIIASGSKLYPTVRGYEKVKSRAARTKFGTDSQLESEIEYLENRLKDRSEYRFALDNEPMRLTNVLFLTDQYGRRSSRNRGRIRVSAVILGISETRAIINYKDANFTVSVGDSIDKFVVSWIDTEEVVLTGAEKEYHYPVVTSAIDDQSDRPEKKRRSN
ncbi:MAG: hypothetical protein GXO90_04110 [FCB group bacterium]|nr:hypothetical protein [FCB group bacterium]